MTLDENSNKIGSIASSYLKIFLKLEERLSHSIKLLKLITNSIYLIILTHLLTKLL